MTKFRFTAQAAHDVGKVMPTLTFLQGAPDNALEGYLSNRLQRIFERCYRTHPFKGANRRQVAYHEAGHLIAHESGGLLADSAFIARDGNSWFGAACDVKNKLRDSGVRLPQHYSAHDLTTEATALIAGPLAEALFARGDLLSSPAELFLAHLLTRRAATMLRRDWQVVLAEAVAEASAILLAYEAEVKRVATLLMRWWSVDRHVLRELFARVRQSPHAAVMRHRRAEMPALDELEQLINRPCPYKVDARLSPRTRRA